MSSTGHWGHVRRGPRRDLGLAGRAAFVVGIIALLYGLLIAAVTGALIYAAVVGDYSSALEGACLTAFIGAFAVRYLQRLDEKALSALHTHVVTPAAHPELSNALARLAAAGDVHAPRLAILDSLSANAFSVALTPRRSTIVLTKGLLERLNAQEVDAVLAHELAHVSNWDGILMTIAAVPSIIRGRRGADRVAAVVLAILLFPLVVPAYVLAGSLMAALSRQREFFADRGSALLTGAPEQLMSALVKLARDNPPPDLRTTAASALCITSTRQRRFPAFRDHPPLSKRLDELSRIARELGRPVPS